MNSQHVTLKSVPGIPYSRTKQSIRYSSIIRIVSAMQGKQERSRRGRDKDGKVDSLMVFNSRCVS